VKILRWDLVGGISGDIALGALLDLGADGAVVQSAIHSCGLDGVRVEIERIQDTGLCGLRARVLTPAHGESQGHHGDNPPHLHRSWREIREMLSRAALEPPVREMAHHVFERLAQAEGRVHGIAPDDVEFHEIGAVDSIADIVGACAALHSLGVEAVEVGTFPIGRGQIRCAHGVYPLPAPAVVELLKGWPVEMVEEDAETVTPTGAALLTEWASASAAAGAMRVIRATGMGWGHRRLRGRPNCARAVLFETIETAHGSPAECLVLETEMDDVPGEWIGILVERLRQLGALDVYTTPIQMKKQRPGWLVTALCEPARRDVMLDVMFQNSPTFGVREYRAQRTVLERRWSTVETPWGPVRVKLGIWKGQVVTRAPEMEDCVARAREHDIPPRQVYEAAMRSGAMLNDAKSKQRSDRP